MKPTSPSLRPISYKPTGLKREQNKKAAGQHRSPQKPVEGRRIRVVEGPDNKPIIEFVAPVSDDIKAAIVAHLPGQAAPADEPGTGQTKKAAFQAALSAADELLSIMEQFDIPPAEFLAMVKSPAVWQALNGIQPAAFDLKPCDGHLDRQEFAQRPRKAIVAAVMHCMLMAGATRAACKLLLACDTRTCRVMVKALLKDDPASLEKLTDSMEICRFDAVMTDMLSSRHGPKYEGVRHQVAKVRRTWRWRELQPQILALRKPHPDVVIGQDPSGNPSLNYTGPASGFPLNLVVVLVELINQHPDCAFDPQQLIALALEHARTPPSHAVPDTVRHALNRLTTSAQVMLDDALIALEPATVARAVSVLTALGKAGSEEAATRVKRFVEPVPPQPHSEADQFAARLVLEAPGRITQYLDAFVQVSEGASEAERDTAIQAGGRKGLESLMAAAAVLDSPQDALTFNANLTAFILSRDCPFELRDILEWKSLQSLPTTLAKLLESSRQQAAPAADAPPAALLAQWIFLMDSVVNGMQTNRWRTHTGLAGYWAGRLNNKGQFDLPLALMKTVDQSPKERRPTGEELEMQFTWCCVPVLTAITTATITNQDVSIALGPAMGVDTQAVQKVLEQQPPSAVINTLARLAATGSLSPNGLVDWMIRSKPVDVSWNAWLEDLLPLINVLKIEPGMAGVGEAMLNEFIELAMNSQVGFDFAHVPKWADSILGWATDGMTDAERGQLLATLQKKRLFEKNLGIGFWIAHQFIQDADSDTSAEVTAALINAGLSLKNGELAQLGRKLRLGPSPEEASKQISSIEKQLGSSAAVHLTALLLGWMKAQLTQRHANQGSLPGSANTIGAVYRQLKKFYKSLISDEAHRLFDDPFAEVKTNLKEQRETQKRLSRK